MIIIERKGEKSTGWILFAVEYILFSSVFLIPMFLVFNKYLYRSLMKTVVYLVFAMYIVALYSLVGLPDVLYIRFDFGHNFVPFYGMAGPLVETMLNVLLFVPLGFFLPVLCATFRRFRNTFLFGLSATAIIEALQIFTYRATDINDVITNSFGTVIGFLAAFLITGRFLRFVFYDKNTKGVYAALLSAVGAMFFFVPFISRALGKY